MDEAFPIDRYVESLVLLLSSAKYEDKNYDGSERQRSLKHTYADAAQHYLQEIQQGELKVNIKYFEPMLATVVAFAVYCYPNVPADVKTAIAIYFTYMAILDDDTEDKSQPSMATFWEDLVHGKEQRHPWWRVMSKQLVRCVKHYGSFCAFNIVRTAFDFFQGCWIEQHNFHGFPGSEDYPLFLRRLTALGHASAGFLFPAEQFDEVAQFSEIVSAIAPIENLAGLVNDLMSFYKEFEEPRDQVSLVRNYCAVEGATLDQSLEYLTNQAIRACEQLATVFEDKNPQVKAALHAWLHGSITWYLCDSRYRMNEVLERAAGSPHGMEFLGYYEQGRAVGNVDLEKWAVPSISELLEQGNNSSS